MPPARHPGPGHQPHPGQGRRAGTNEGSVLLADFSQIAVARDLAPSVKLLDQTYAAYDQQAIRVIARYDAAPLNPMAVIVLRGVTS